MFFNFYISVFIELKDNRELVHIILGWEDIFLRFLLNFIFFSFLYKNIILNEECMLHICCQHSGRERIPLS